jgi:hypothetical protein
VRLRTPAGHEFATYSWRDGQIVEYWGHSELVTRPLEVVGPSASPQG